MSIAVAIFGCAPNASDASRVRYALASPDVGETWHLHTKDGTFVCELPCEAWVGEKSGDYLVVHEPRVWRVNLPSELPASPGGSVVMDAHVGKGSPALGTFGTGLAITGAATAAAGIAIGVGDFISLFTNCADDGSCFQGSTGAIMGVAGALLGAGAILGVVGVYLMDHNRGARSHIVVTPTSLSGSF